MRKAMVLVGWLLAVSGCSDPRLRFAGTWKGPMRTIVKFQDGSSQTFPKGEATVVIDAPPRSDQLNFNGSCGMSATVNDDRTFAVNKRACPTERISFPDASGTRTVMCDLVETVNGGIGTRATTSLTLSYFGDSQIGRCTDGLDSFATYTSELTLTDQ